MAAWLCLKRMETWNDSKCLRKLIQILIITAPVLHAQSSIPSALIPKPVTFRATTTTNNSYYVGEPLTVYCKSHGLLSKTDPWSELRNLVILVNNVTQIQCNDIEERGEFSWYPSPEVDSKLDLSDILSTDCRNRANISYHNFIFNITEGFVNHTWTCTDNYYGNYQASNSSLIIESIKKPPRNLAMTLYPEQIIEDQEFKASCTSTSSNEYKYRPNPFKYELVRGENSEVINNGRYTPSAEDRGGFRVKCTDTKNPDWRAIADIERVRDVIPIYVDFGPNGTDKQTKTYSAEVEGDIFVCDIIGFPSVDYYWSSTKEEADFEGHTGRVLRIVNTDRVHAQYENVTCTGYVSTSSGNPLTKMMEWHISWEGTSSSSFSSAGVYVWVFGGLFIIALIVGLDVFVLSGKMRNKLVTEFTSLLRHYRGENSVVIENERGEDRSGFKVKRRDTKNPDWGAIDDIKHVKDVTPISEKREPEREKKGRRSQSLRGALDTPQKSRRKKHRSKSRRRSSKKHSTKVSGMLE